MMVREVESFSVVGLEARTTNAAETDGAGVIPELWGRYLSENSPAGPLYALYSDYESDHDGAYTFFIGARMRAGKAVPDGQVVRDVPAGKYQIFTSERGPLVRMVPQVWQRIWSETQNRAYLTDFELYDTRAEDPLDGQVDVYIGLK